MNPRTLLLALIATAALAVPVAISAMPGAQAWEIGPLVRGRNYSVGMPAHPRPGPKGSLVLDIPLEGVGQIDAMTTPVGPLAGARRIILDYRVDAAPGTRFIADEMPDEPAAVSLYFQQAGDNWSGRGRFASYRWYAPGRTVIPLSPGRHTVTIGLDEAWTNVRGQSNQVESAGFAAAMADTATLGVAFGSAGRRSHGIYATGPARFTLLRLDIE